MQKHTLDKKTLSNRENAMKSTGPKTQKGKENSRDNSVKHGVYATRRLIRGEDEALYDEIKKEQSKIFKPKTFVEKALVDQLVGDLWTLRRIARAENLLFKNVGEEISQESESPLRNQLAQIMTREPIPQAEPNVTLPRSAAIFERLFMEHRNQAAFERITSFKRQLLNHILMLERELKRRRTVSA